MIHVHVYLMANVKQFFNAEHKITYLDHFLGATEGTVYITSYKMYFKSDPNPKNTVSLSLSLTMFLYVSSVRSFIWKA